jgi:PKD repeat protein
VSLVSLDSGVLTIGLRVTDEDGTSDTDTTTVTVENGIPVANAGGPYTGDEGSDITLDASGSSDPGNDIVSYVWDFDGDGEFDDAVGETAIFNSTDSGVFEVSLKVTDLDGLDSTDTASVTVENVTPTADAGGPYTGFENVPVSFDASGSTDPGDDIVSYEWDFDGDGEFDDASGQFVDFTFATFGSYTVALRVTDADDAIGTDTASVEISEQPPEVCGDQDSDELVTILDLVIDMKISAGSLVPDVFQSRLSDLDGDEDVDRDDANILIGHLVDLVPELNECGAGP